MSHSPLFHKIKKAIAESVQAFVNNPVASAQVVDRPAALSQIETIAGEGLAQAYLQQIRKRGLRCQLLEHSSKTISAAWSRCTAQSKD